MVVIEHIEGVDELWGRKEVLFQMDCTGRVIPQIANLVSDMKREQKHFWISLQYLI